MVKICECPACHNNGIKIDMNKGYKFVATGRPMKDFPAIVVCSVCKRKIKYDIVKDEENA